MENDMSDVQQNDSVPSLESQGQIIAQRVRTLIREVPDLVSWMLQLDDLPLSDEEFAWAIKRIDYLMYGLKFAARRPVSSDEVVGEF
jgi:hypothetical protein